MDDIFNDLGTHGKLAKPNVRGNVNRETTGFDYEPLLDDEFGYEGMPPGPGAAVATDLFSGGADVDVDPLDFEDDEENAVPQGTPGMVQTTYGAHSWGIDTSRGHRPESMMTADRNMNAMGGDEVPVGNPPQDPQAGFAASNDNVDTDTLDDQADDEDEDMRVYGHGIFGGEASTTWRPSYGSFGHQFALPDYIGKEDEMAVQGSAMWDQTRGAWRVVQPTASGVALSRIVPGSPNGQVNSYSPFVPQNQPPVVPTGPASQNIERFGHEVASTIVRGAATLPAEQRGRFIANAIEALGPGLSQRANRTAKRLVELGHPKEVALHDTLAHLVMHVTGGDLAKAVDQTKRGRRPAQGTLPSISRLTERTGPVVGGRIKQLRSALLATAESTPAGAAGELGSFYASQANGKIGWLGLGETEPPATPLTTPVQPAVAQAPTPTQGLLRPRNLLIGAAVLGGAYLLYQSDASEKVQKNGRAAPSLVVQPNKVKAVKTHRRAKKARRTSRSKR